jgi:hypothetical protein
MAILKEAGIIANTQSNGFVEVLWHKNGLFAPIAAIKMTKPLRNVPCVESVFVRHTRELLLNGGGCRIPQICMLLLKAKMI